MRKTIILVTLITLTGCAGTSIKYVSPESFIQKANEIDGSATWYTYIGKSTRRIYLEYGNVITSGLISGLSDKPAVTVYWTNLDQIPDGFVLELEQKKIKHTIPKPMSDWEINKKLDLKP